MSRDDLKKGTCRGCGKEVLFAMDEHGKTQILDPRPPVYDVELVEGENFATRRPDAMVSHFATCPNANEFGGSKRMKAAAERASHPAVPGSAGEGGR